MSRPSARKYTITIAPDQLTRGICPECGTETDLFEGFCLQPTNCRYDHDARVGRHVGRAIQAGVPYVWFDPRDIFEAFDWRCYLCGTDTPKALYGKMHPQAPQLDHIVPISRGGPHTPQNTACSCRRCNSMKGDLLLKEFNATPRMLSAAALANVTSSSDPPWSKQRLKSANIDDRFKEAAEAGRRAAEESLKGR